MNGLKLLMILTKNLSAKRITKKRERLRILHDTVGLPFDNPTQFSATEISGKSKKFQRFFDKHKNEYCALRLIPLDTSFPKLRLRGVTVKEVMKWYEEQNIDPAKYRGDFIPHSENAIWSTIFVVNKNGFFGEIIAGMHNQLTQGFYSENKPILFSFDFKKLKLSHKNLKVQKHLKEIISHLKIKSDAKRKKLQKVLKAKFANNYLLGYFETISTKDYGLWFIDYNRILGEKYADYSFRIDQNNKATGAINGLTASRGIATGKVKVLDPQSTTNVDIEKGDVLVCEMTTPDHVIHIQKVAAIVTDKGGVLSHAAIVAREFSIPCIVGTKNATLELKDGDLVEVNADKGTVKIINKNVPQNPD